jgi:hypothetical protein
MNSHRLRLLGMLDEGMLDPMTTVGCLVGWLSNDDVGAFLDAHELSERFIETKSETESRLRNSGY